MTYKIFLAWQSQNKNVSMFIKKALDKAQKVLQDEGINIKIIKSPTQEDSGSPDITGLIWKQIQTADVFIGDLTFVETTIGLSNNNVMYEVGIADALLGEERVILLCDSETKIEKLAFDINHKRVSTININDANFYKNLAIWIRKAIESDDRQRFVKRYATDEYATDLITLINYFYRLVYLKDNDYSEGFSCPDKKHIQEALDKATIGFYAAKVCFDEIIRSLDEKLLRLISMSDERVTWHIMNIISALKDYQQYCTSTKYSYLDVDKSSKEQYGIYDKRTFHLQPGSDVDMTKGSPFFNDNCLICLTANYCIVLDKRIVEKTNENIKIKNLSLPDLSKQTVAVMETVSFNKSYTEMLSFYIFEILKSLFMYFEYCDIRLTNEKSKDGAKMGIITMEL